MAKNKYDIAIIGGGTVGSMLFLDAASRGLSCLLIESKKVGMQTNRASLGLIQAGLNYLIKNREFVEMNAVDCNLMKHIAGDFLRRQQFMLPVFPDSKYPLWLWDGYLEAYDEFNKGSHPKHILLSGDKVYSKEPTLRDDVGGGVIFNEWVADPIRLTQAIIKAGVEMGGTIIEDTEVVSAIYEDDLNKKRISFLDVVDSSNVISRVNASLFINALGPWTPSALKKIFDLDSLDTRMTRGTSIIIKKRLSKRAIIIFDGSNKYITVLPIDNDTTLIGPTNIDIDDEVAHNPDKLMPEEDEISGLIDMINSHFQIKVTKKDICDTRCGIRPQLAHHNVKPNNISHEFMIIDHDARDGVTNLITEFGGKLSNQIRMAKEAMDLACEKLGRRASWRVPYLKITEWGCRERKSVVADSFFSLYEKKYALAHDDNIGSIALSRKIDAMYRLTPFIGKSLLKTLPFQKKEENMTDAFFVEKLISIFGSDGVITDKRMLHDLSYDKCPKHLLGKDLNSVCFVAVRPSLENYPTELSKLILAVKKHGKRIVVRGGGSGVCGAAVPRYGSDTVVVDMTSIDSVVVNKKRGYVDAGAGVMGSRIEEELNKENLTLGHSPASLNISTPGGWVATRSSGQFSSQYGTIEDLTLGIEVISQNGFREVIEGDDLKSFFRMEGATGIITSVKMKTFSRASYNTFRAYSFKDIGTALEVMESIFEERSMLESGGDYVKAIRLYDFIDYNFVAKPHKVEKKTNNLKLKEKKSGSGLKVAFEKFMTSHPAFVGNLCDSLATRSLMILALSSDTEAKVNKFAKNMDSAITLHNGKIKDEKIAKNWYENRYKLSYEKLESRYKEGMVIDTFDCRCRFDNMQQIYRSVKKSVEDLAVTSAHFGMDREGPYIYFTFAGLGGKDLYQEIWYRAIKACYENGGHTTHHHGLGFLKIGRDNALAEYGYGKEWLDDAVKAKNILDPDNIFNPGNIF